MNYTWSRVQLWSLAPSGTDLRPHEEVKRLEHIWCWFFVFLWNWTNWIRHCSISDFLEHGGSFQFEFSSQQPTRVDWQRNWKRSATPRSSAHLWKKISISHFIPLIDWVCWRNEINISYIFTNALWGEEEGGRGGIIDAHPGPCSCCTGIGTRGLFFAFGPYIISGPKEISEYIKSFSASFDSHGRRLRSRRNGRFKKSQVKSEKMMKWMDQR